MPLKCISVNLEMFQVVAVVVVVAALNARLVQSFCICDMSEIHVEQGLTAGSVIPQYSSTSCTTAGLLKEVICVYFFKQSAD